jgi:hypothetical protein
MKQPTPKEKADQLIEDFILKAGVSRWEALVCVEIFVDEMMEEYMTNIRELNIDVIHQNPIQFWEEVKKEIEKL